MKKSRSYKVFFSVLLISFIIVVPLINAQKIRIKTENGIPVIYNPKKPAPPQAS